jgi:sulfofructose kinase
LKTVTPLIAGVGICCLDYIFVAPQAHWGTTAFVKDFNIQGGGLVGTALVACARLGAHCDLFSRLGDDIIADQILSELDTEGVATQAVARIAGGASPFSLVHVDETTGERTIFHRPGTGLESADADNELSLPNDTQVLIVDDIYLDLSITAAKVAQAAHIPVIADLTPTPRSTELLRHVDILIAPRDYLRELGCENDPSLALAAIHDMGPATAVITMGADGWIYSGRSGHGSGFAFPVAVVDTTGAGDAFHGAFAYGVASGWDTPRSAEFAAAVAAIKCTQPGGRTGLPNLQQTIEFIRTRSTLGW